MARCLVTENEVGEVVDLLLASYPTQRQRMTRDDSRAMTLAYASALRDLDADAARAAVSALVLTERWIPTIAAIRAKAAELTQGRARTGAEAWGDVAEAMRRYGSHRAPGVDFEFADPLVAQVVQRFGWRDLCASDVPGVDRAQFERAYNELAERAAQDRAVAGALAVPRRELPSGLRPLGEVIANALPGGRP
jgi:hypothetical protein